MCTQQDPSPRRDRCLIPTSVLQPASEAQWLALPAVFCVHLQMLNTWIYWFVVRVLPSPNRGTLVLFRSGLSWNRLKFCLSAFIQISNHSYPLLFSHFSSLLTTMWRFRSGRKEGLTPGSGAQHGTDDEQPPTYLSNTDADNVAPIDYPSPNQGSRSTQSSAIRELKCEVLASWLLAKAEERMWIEGNPGEGVFVKKHKGSYAHSPDLREDDSTGLHQAINTLNVRVR
jgi:hypothetical protein